MAEEKMSMPSGFGGLVRYFDEYKSKVQLKPEHVVLIAAFFVAVEIMIRI